MVPLPSRGGRHTLRFGAVAGGRPVHEAPGTCPPPPPPPHPRGPCAPSPTSDAAVVRPLRTSRAWGRRNAKHRQRRALRPPAAHALQTCEGVRCPRVSVPVSVHEGVRGRVSEGVRVGAALPVTKALRDGVADHVPEADGGLGVGEAANADPLAVALRVSVGASLMEGDPEKSEGAQEDGPRPPK